jgi:hypothetical protein
VICAALKGEYNAVTVLLTVVVPRLRTTVGLGDQRHIFKFWMLSTFLQVSPPAFPLGQPMGATGRSGASVGSGFVAGVLIGVAVVVFVAPPPSGPGPTADQSGVKAQHEVSTSLASNSDVRGRENVGRGMSAGGSLAISTGACASALSLEQDRRSVLAVNVAGLETDLKTLRNNRGCDVVCKQSVSTSKSCM